MLREAIEGWWGIDFYLTRDSPKIKHFSGFSMSNEEIVLIYQNTEDEEEKRGLAGQIYHRNLSLIRKIAGKYSAYAETEDLEQESFFAIKTAADLYDQSAGATFASYAYQWIRASMRRYIDNGGSSVRIPSNRRDSIIKYGRLVSDYEKSLGRAPTDGELMKLLGIDCHKLEELKSDSYRLRIRSLDEPIGEDITLADTVPDGEAFEDNVIEIEDNKQLALILWAEVAELEEDEGQVIRKRFESALTLRETGEAFGMTADKARLLQDHAIRKLRKSKRLKAYREDYILSHAFYGGLGRFNHTFTSATEKTAIDLIEKSNG